MAEKKKDKKDLRKPDRERQMAFESLPPGIREEMTKDEIEIFLYAKEWPEELFKKMDEFIVKKEKD